MDCVLHNNANLSDEENDDLANAFDEEYSDKPEEFLQLMNARSFAVKGTYEETWDFIKNPKFLKKLFDMSFVFCFINLLCMNCTFIFPFPSI